MRIPAQRNLHAPMAADVLAEKLHFPQRRSQAHPRISLSRAHVHATPSQKGTPSGGDRPLPLSQGPRGQAKCEYLLCCCFRCIDRFSQASIGQSGLLACSISSATRACEMIVMPGWRAICATGWELADVNGAILPSCPQRFRSTRELLFWVRCLCMQAVSIN